MPDQIAIIDLGTNTFHLLIAEKRKEHYEIVHREKQAVKIGERGINQDLITDEGLARAITALTYFKRQIEQFPAGRIFAFGTSAIRNARNQSYVQAEIKARTGIKVIVLTGDQEAEFIYYGINYAMNLGIEKSLIMDIGGGSVEFIIGNKDRIFWKESVEIGGQRLLEEFHKHDPITPDEIEALDEYLASKLKSLFTALNQHNPITLIGASGTFDTLSDIYCLKNGITKDAYAPETPLTIDSIYKLYHEFIAKNRAQRMAIPGMIEMRVDMIVVACCLIRYILERYTFRRVRVSGYSLKEGAFNYLVRQSNALN